MDSTWPTGGLQMDEWLTRLGVDEIDRTAMIEWQQSLSEDDHARVADLTERIVRAWDVRFMTDPVPELLSEDELAAGPARGALAALAFAAAGPQLHERYLAAGFDERASLDTLADLAAQLRKHRRVFGQAGLATAWWLCEVYSRGFVQLGRLQYQLVRHDLGLPGGEPVWAMSVHIPASGPLTPDEVDESLTRASTFFEDRLPELVPIDWFLCSSWLLDPALGCLVPGSNIAAFGARWDVFHITESDWDAYFFGFDVDPGPGELPRDLDALPADNRLHRAMIEHWRDGEHFMLASGRIPVIRQMDAD